MNAKRERRMQSVMDSGNSWLVWRLMISPLLPCTSAQVGVPGHLPRECWRTATAFCRLDVVCLNNSGSICALQFSPGLNPCGAWRCTAALSVS